MQRKIGGFAEDLLQEPSICVLETKICCRESAIKIKNYIEHTKQVSLTKLTEEAIIEAAIDLLDLDSELDLWQTKHFRDYVGHAYADQIIRNYFKPKGPAHSTRLLDNIVIDECLRGWMLHSMNLFNKRFLHIGYQMLDFAKYPGQFSSLDLIELEKNYDCFGLILNSDISTGPGKHWVAIYGVFNQQRDQLDFEFFNSSGNPIYEEVVEFCSKFTGKIMVNLIRVNHKRLQRSKTECGVWSLLYIKNRLLNRSMHYFFKQNTNDDDIVKLRKYLFRA
jgi:hypothetical protein